MTTEGLSSPRLLAGVAGEVEVTVYEDGSAVDILADPAPACTLVNAATGAEFVESPVVEEVPTGRLRVSLTAAQTATPAVVKATWAFSVGDPAVAHTLVSYHEIVGDVPFTLSEARAFDDGAMDNEETYPVATVLAMRDRIAEAIEEITAVSFGTRAAREWTSGDGSRVAWLSKMDCQSVTGVALRERGTQDWTAFDSGELADLALSPNGRLERETRGGWPVGSRNIRVDLLHGREKTPLEIKRAALIVLRHHLPGNNLPANAISQVDQLGTFQLSIPGRRDGVWFGLPEADEILSRYRRKLPGVA